ncbi:MAG: carboxypeptidase-like regulatory domain-containing protein, partial [Syntrophothermus sp.]
MIKKILSLVLLILFSSIIPVFAGNTGKISGKVTDATTSEALIGINVVLEGTKLGAATDVNGNYIISNVEPGSYNVIVSGIGYQKKIIQNVKVNSDFTTSLDIQLNTETLNLETVVIQATNP